MAFDEGLAERIRALVSDDLDVRERKMFGGLCFMHWGNMLCGVESHRLMLRVGPDAHADALAQPHAAPMDFTGRPMKGIVFVEPPGIATDRDLEEWLNRGLKFSSSLPRKGAK